MKHILCSIVLIGLIGCGGDSSTSPTTPQTTTTTISVIPVLTSHDARIVRSSGNYHYISWKFTINSPIYYSSGYVVARWFDADNFQVEWTNWLGPLNEGIHTYTDETMIKKEIWAQVVRREVTLESWY